MTAARCFDDITDVFDFDEPTLDYYDRPLSGWLRRRNDGRWFAFDCQEVVAGFVWHWTLVSADERKNVRQTLEAACASTTGTWLSVLEDRRNGPRGSCTMVELQNAAARPEVLAARFRRSIDSDA